MRAISNQHQMERCAAILLLATLVRGSGARVFCDGSYRPLEVGTWKSSLTHLDSGVVENGPVSMDEGQVYVYENEFPGHTIKYVHVDNLAIRTCGATAQIKAGGVGASSVLVVVHARTNNEIRAVIDIWGVRDLRKATKPPLASRERKTLRSLYLSKDFRPVNHNVHYF